MPSIDALLSSPLLAPAVILLLCAASMVACAIFFVLEAPVPARWESVPLDMEEVELTALSHRIVKLSDEDQATLRKIIEYTVTLLEEGRLVRIEP